MPRYVYGAPAWSCQVPGESAQTWPTLAGLTRWFPLTNPAIANHLASSNYVEGFAQATVISVEQRSWSNVGAGPGDRERATGTGMGTGIPTDRRDPADVRQRHPGSAEWQLLLHRVGVAYVLDVSAGATRRSLKAFTSSSSAYLASYRGGKHAFASSTTDRKVQVYERARTVCGTEKAPDAEPSTRCVPAPARRGRGGQAYDAGRAEDEGHRHTLPGASFQMDDLGQVVIRSSSRLRLDLRGIGPNPARPGALRAPA